MNNILGRLYYVITGDTAALEKNLDASKKKMQALGKEIDSTSKKIRDFAKGALTAALIKGLTEAASRAEEMQNRFNTVFRGISSEIEAWADTYAEATSRGRLDTMEFLSAQQDIRTGFGDTVEGAAEFSKAVVGITNDLASFANVPVEEAMAAVNSGLNGEFEALRRLGVGLNVAIINQMDYAEALGKTWDEMDNLERQEAILSGIVSQSSNALHQNITMWQDYDYTLGDAASTAGSFANRLQGFMQTLTDFKAELGDELLPIASSVLGSITDLMNGFNDLDSSLQTVIVSASAAGAAFLLIGGPIGIATAAVAGLAIGMSNIQTPAERLEDSMAELSEAAMAYSEATEHLSSKTDELTEKQRTLLEAEQTLARSRANSKLGDVAFDYSERNNQIEEEYNHYLRLKGVYDAYNLAVREGAAKVTTEIARVSRTGRENMTEFEKAYVDALASIRGLDFDSESFKQSLAEAKNAMDEASTAWAEDNVALQENLYQLGVYFHQGLLDLSAYEGAFPDLCEEIRRTAAEIKEMEEQTAENTETAEEAITATTEWRDALREQKAEMLEAGGAYKEAAELRLEMLQEEQDAAIRQLASDSGVIKSGESVADLTIEALRERLNATEETNAELIALDEYYANESLKLHQDLQDNLNEQLKKKEESAEEVREMLSGQQKAEAEATISELENSGRIEEALALRKQLINEERDAAVASMQAKIDAGEATLSELEGINEYYDNEIIKAEEDAAAKEKELAEERAEAERKAAEEAAEAEAELAEKRRNNAEETSALLTAQAKEKKENSIKELEAEGKYAEALELRKSLILEERNLAIAAMNEKVAANEATWEDISRLVEYYSNEILKAEEETAEKERKLAEERAEAERKTAEKAAEAEAVLAEKRRKNAEETSTLLSNQTKEKQETSIKELEAEGKYREALELRKSLILEERNLAIAAMNEKVAANEATWEDISRLIEYYNNEILKAEEETAEKEKEIADERAEAERKAAEEAAEAEAELAERRRENAEETSTLLSEQAREAQENTIKELEAEGKYAEALEIRKALILEERNLAIAAMNEKVAANEATWEDISRLVEYYSNEIIKAEEETAEKEKELADERAEDERKAAEKAAEAEAELAEKRRKNAEKTNSLLADQERSYRENQIRELESEGKFSEAFQIRKALILEERNLAIAAMNEKVAANEATQEDISRIIEYYNNEIIFAANEATEAANEYRANETKEIDKTYRERLRKQQESSKLSMASELESLGNFQEALTIRKNLIEEERQAAIKALEDKKLAEEEYQEELAALNAYYDGQIQDEIANTAEKEIEAQRAKAEEIKDINRSLYSQLLSFAKDFSSSIGDIYSAITERRLQQIDDETDAALEALGLQEDTELEKLQKEYTEAVKNGDMELAQEKDREIQRTKIEEEAAEKKAALQQEEAQRSKQLAIFQATIDTLASVIGFMSDPGGWAGIAMSAMAAATAAAQIAAIAAEPLPSYAVGAAEITEDQIAQIHQGELIVPKTFAEGIRDGDISIGGTESKVEVTIVNNTGAKASVDRMDSDSLTKLRITIGDVVASEISKGRLDSAMTQRFSITRRNPRG